MAGRNYKQEGYHQGLEDGKKVRNKKEMGKKSRPFTAYIPLEILWNIWRVM